jgi:peptidoglycan hydrolase-like protein with peptidoglycan-binding domain
VTRGRAVAATTAVLLLASAGVGWVLIGPKDDDASADKTPSYELASVERRDLRVGTRLSGRWGYGALQPVPIRASGTVTWLPSVGEQANRGDVLLRVDNRPVVLMYGATPAYRPMDAGSHPDPAATSGGDDQPKKPTSPPKTTPPSVGPDVEQLELSLSQLGYTGFTVDQEFTEGTAAAVRAWQESLGVPPTGRVDLGDVVFLPGPVRLHPSPQSLGQSVSDSSVQQSGTERLVTVEAEDADWAETGVRVDVTLPNRKTVPGRVTAVASGGGNSESGGTGSEHVSIRLTREYPRVAPGPVEVTYVSARRRDVLTIPVTALVALAEGGYAVELDDGEYVAVEPGLYAEGVVEVAGELKPGTKVRVPR